jgi:osmotically-inducible protein OsmY
MTRKKIFAGWVAGSLALVAGMAFADAPAPQATDSQITDRVMGKLSVDDPQLIKRVQVETKDGVVTLSGRAYTGGEMAKALRDAGSVAGVVKVQNRMSM